MQVNLQNNNYINNYDIKQNMPQNPSFKKVYRLNIVLDGKKVSDTKVRRDIFKYFRGILFDNIKPPSMKNETIQKMKKFYDWFDYDFCYCRKDIHDMNRSLAVKFSKNGDAFCFSGPTASGLRDVENKKTGKDKKTLIKYYKELNKDIAYWRKTSGELKNENNLSKLRKQELTLNVATGKGTKYQILSGEATIPKTKQEIAEEQFAAMQKQYIEMSKENKPAPPKPPVQTDLFNDMV